jgi:hypothetical protein
VEQDTALCVCCDENNPVIKDEKSASYGKLDEGQHYFFYWNLCEDCYEEEMG